MNAIAPIVAAPIDGEIIAPSATVRVIGRLHPFRSARIEADVPAGITLAEALDLAFASETISEQLAVHVNGVAVPAAWWPRVRLKPDVTVTFRPVPRDGGTLKAVLSLAVVVAALFVAGPIAGFLGLTGAALTVGTALISGAIVLGGTLALNALFPTPATSSLSPQGFTQLNSIQGAQNQAQPFNPITVVLGTHLQSPVYAAKPYTEIVGDDQYLRLLFCWGYGPLEIDNICVGTTPLADYADVEIETRQGFADDAPITLYPSAVDEIALSITLPSSTEDFFGQTISDADLTAEGLWVTQVSGPDADVLAVDFTYPDGVYHVNATTGNPDPWLSYVLVQYRVAGSGAAWTDLIRYIVVNRAVQTTRIGESVTVARGQYEVRAAHATNSPVGDSSYKDTVVWTALRTFTNEPPTAFAKPLAFTALRIRATDQLNGVISTLNGICKSLVLAYSGADGVWNANTASQNPADLFRWVLQAPANARPVGDAGIDIANLQDWWTYCTAQGFKYNRVLTQTGGTVYATLAEIAAAGRAVPTFIDGKWGVIWDRPDDPIVQHFTPRNSWGFSGTHPYATLPQGWRVQFIDETNGYVTDERRVFADGFDETSATLYEQIEFPGVTDPNLIWRFGRFQIAQVQLRIEENTLSAGWENLICTRGDRVAVTHDVLEIGLASGRVKSVAGQTVTFDETVLIVDGQTYGLSFRVPDPDNTLFLRAVDPAQPAGNTNSLLMVGDLSAVVPGCLFGFGETNQVYAVYRVKTIAHQQDLVAQLVLVDDAPAISTADQGAIPPWTSNVTIPPDPFSLPPQNLQVQQVFDGAGASVRALGRLTWQVPRFGKITSFEVQYDDIAGNSGWTQAGTVAPPTTTFNVPVIDVGQWGFRVRCLFDDGTVSAWATLSPVVMDGLLTTPADVANFRWSYVTGRSELDWDPVIDPRGILYEMRKGASWDAGLTVGDAIAQPRFQTIGDETYWVAAYVISPFGARIYSVTKQSLTLTDSVLTDNVVVSHDEGAEGWTGSLTGFLGIDQQQKFLRSGGTDNILANTDVLGTGSILDAGGQGGGTYISATIVNAGRISRCRVSVDYEATAVSSKADFLAEPSILDDPDVLQSYLTQFIRVYPIIRTAQSATADLLSAANVLTLGDVLNAGIQWGAWQKWSPDVYTGTLFQLGLGVDILDATANAIAYVLKFAWTVDVEDRLDRYQNLTVPLGGETITFEFGGYNTSPTGNIAAFIGGPNNATVPHVLGDILNAPTLSVAITNVTKSSCIVQVLNSSTGADVGGSGVNVFAQGY